MQFDCIFFIGPQGSGKGTQADILAKKIGFFYWEMGAILREIAKNNDKLGKKVKALIDAGVLLEDDLLLEVVKKRLSLIPKAQGIIFDGIPRRLGQAKFLLNYLAGLGKKNSATIFINIHKEISINRLLKRATTEKRADDSREAIELRLKQYYEATVPVLDFLKTQTTFFEIDGSPEIAEVTKEINQALGLN